MVLGWPSPATHTIAMELPFTLPSGRTASRNGTVEMWIVAAGFCALWLMLGWRVLDLARVHDFLAMYSGAYLTSHGLVAKLYDPAAQLAVQKIFVPTNVQLVPFVRPPFYALLLAPLAWLPFRAAFVCWILLQIGVLTACWAWAWQRFGAPAVVFGCMSMPAALGIAHGQDCVVFLAVLIASYALTEANKEFTSGLVLGLLLVKFHLTFLWPVALILQRRWKALAGFLTTAAATAGISLAIVGADGARRYAALLQNHSLAWLLPSPEFMISFQGLAANFGVTSMPAQAALVAAVVTVLLGALWHAPLWRAYAATTAASLLVAPHVYGYDAAMLVLGLWLAAFRAGNRSTRMVALWLFTPLPFAFTLVGKPWAAVSSLSLLGLLLALAAEAGRLWRASTPEGSVAVPTRAVPILGGG